MLHQVVSVEWVRGTILQLTFEGGHVGTLELSKLVTFDGYLSKLKNEDFFRKVSINTELGTICWPDEIDFCPDSLHKWAFEDI